MIDTSGAAVITCGGFHAVLRPGEQLLFGRSATNDLRFGHSPEDTRVPRTAGRLECRADGVLIHNLSDKRTLTIHTFPGPGYEIAPLMIAGTHPFDYVRVSLNGSAAKYLLYVDTRNLPGARRGEWGGGPEEPATSGFHRLDDMHPRHRFFLTALCLPLLTSSGPAGDVPTYAAIEKLLSERGYAYKAKTVRNNLDELRHWLTYEHDIDDLMAEDDPAGPSRVVHRLAEWAVRSGNVTDRDVERLENHTTGGGVAG